MRDFTDLMKMDLEPKGVMVQASTLGALEALMQFLRKECDPPIPVFAVGIGAVYKKDVMRASIMNEKVSNVPTPFGFGFVFERVIRILGVHSNRG